MKNTLIVTAILLALPMEGECIEGKGIPDEFQVASAKIELVLTCPWDHRRTYTLNGDGSFAFVDAARSELDPGHVDMRLVDDFAEVDFVGFVVMQIIESSFPYLPSRVGDKTYVSHDGVVTKLDVTDVTVSTSCEAELTLTIGAFVKSVNYADIQLLPSGLLDSVQSLSGESES